MDGRVNRIVFAGGGTGGHLFPALAVADELARRDPARSIRFVGGRRGLEQKLVPAAGYPLQSLRLSGIKGRGAPQRLAAGIGAAWAVVRSGATMLTARPDLVIGVGGYASGPAVLAARLLRVPTMVLEQNHFPGATNRWLAPRVDAVCVPSEDARARLGGVGIVTGNPVRPDFFRIGNSPNAASLSVLVFGGSRGAHSINVAMVAAVKGFAAIDPPPTIVHQTGDADEATVRAAAQRYPDGLYTVRAFIDDMANRLARADLVICRAGATTVAELAAAGRAALLVPYPFAADDHQRHNAETLERAGAAKVLLDGDLSGERLTAFLAGITADRERLLAMGQAARELAQPDALNRIATVAETLMSGGDHVS